MLYTIQSLEENMNLQKTVKKFLFFYIKKEYGYGYVPDYHQDICQMKDYYINPHRNIFLVAFQPGKKEVIGTLGIRAYDKNFPILENCYHPLHTASLWRVFVHSKWRRKGVASTLVKKGEEFCKNMGYYNIYLHTHKTVPGSLDFWISQDYKIKIDTDNELGTVHLEKRISIPKSACDLLSISVG
jgi:GNAT superfamily N-acetyltransferase